MMTDTSNAMPQVEQTHNLDYITTDAGNADRLIREHGEDFRYCDALGGWMHWTGLRWQVDNAAIWSRAESIGKTILREAAEAGTKDARDRLWKHGQYSLSKPGMQRMIELASKRLSVKPELFDRDPYLLNCMNGTVHLKTGELLPHDRDDLITKLAPAAYYQSKSDLASEDEAGAAGGAAGAPEWADYAIEWAEFLERIMPSEALRRYLQVAVGYSAIGDVLEHVQFIMYGTGANGKTVFIETVRAALGDYAHRTPTEALMAKNTNNGGPTPELAQMKGKRFVTASESEDGQRLAEARIKDLTGGDTITARHLYREPFEFRPSHTLWLSTNHRPDIRGTDTGIWRRIRLIPFEVRIPEDEQDKGLAGRIRQSELSGVLAWIVAGAIMYHDRPSLLQSDEVDEATRRYQDEMDRIAQFISEECVIGNGRFWVKKGELYKAYQDWCEENGEHAEKQRTFSRRLKEKYGDRIEEGRTDDASRTRIWRGIGLFTAYPDADTSTAELFA